MTGVTPNPIPRIVAVAFCAALLAPTAPAHAFDRNAMKDECKRYRTKTVRNECCDGLYEACVKDCYTGEFHAQLACKDECKQQVNVCKGVGEFELPAPPGHAAPDPGQPGELRPPTRANPRPSLPAQEGAKP